MTMRRPLSRPDALLARLHRLELEHRRAALPSRAVTRAAAGVKRREELAAFHADVISDLLCGALTPGEARQLTRAVEQAYGVGCT